MSQGLQIVSNSLYNKSGVAYFVASKIVISLLSNKINGKIPCIIIKARDFIIKAQHIAIHAIFRDEVLHDDKVNIY